MFNENNCLENLKHIVSEYADDENIKNLSLDELRSSYTKIADNIYSISVSNRLKYKNILWNIDNLKPEIRLRFQAQLFNTWHSVYIKSIKADPTENRPEIKTAEKSPKVDAKKQTSVITEQHPIESKKIKRVSSSEDTVLCREMKPVEKQSPITVPRALTNKYENDWFDKLLDFFAAIVGGVAGLVGH
ncbi:MAG TPA: hypothetical protein DCY53_02575 [Desulfobacteraceae bacterium]|nr:hypothetical protein [Desulfobacteraceae bacterium]